MGTPSNYEKYEQLAILKGTKEKKKKTVEKKKRENKLFKVNILVQSPLSCTLKKNPFPRKPKLGPGLGLGALQHRRSKEEYFYRLHSRLYWLPYSGKTNRLDLHTGLPDSQREGRAVQKVSEGKLQGE